VVADLKPRSYQPSRKMIESTNDNTPLSPQSRMSGCYNQPFINVISLGAGKQSSYMLLTALEGAYKFKPDFAIFSDTGCEPDYVYEYVTWLQDYVKNKYNFDIVIVSAGNIIEDTLNYLDGKKSRVAALPLRLSGNGGLIMRQCTNDYKIAPLRKHLQTIRNGNKVRLWIGISLDEIERIKDSTVKYIENYYPLIENRIRIDQIINWFRENEMREPGKSACLICPFHSDNYWKVFKKQYPDEFEKACKFDDAIRNYPNLKRQTFLSKHLKPLREIDFTQHPSLFPELIEECNGLCGL
jgi:3'-phosphoadenosine 5'-phosphosulfate sulfotransferase (PAPS reductase)/FAD synthetase